MTNNKVFGKGILALALVFALMLAGCNTPPAPGNEPESLPFDDFMYRIEAYQGVTITRYNGQAAEVAIPGVINGMPVTVIGENAFLERDNLTRVIIPAYVTKISSMAFDRCRNLVEVIFDCPSPGYEEKINVMRAAGEIQLPRYVQEVTFLDTENTDF